MTLSTNLRVAYKLPYLLLCSGKTSRRAIYASPLVLVSFTVLPQLLLTNV